MSSVLMLLRSILLALLLLTTASTAASADTPVGEPRYPPRAVIMPVASWCAPCRGELARLDEIAAAAGGRAIRILAIDDSAATVRMLRLVDPALVWRPDVAERVRLRAALLARTAGLPYAVATDVRGAVCAEENGALDAARTAALTHRCKLP
jgi:thiol-disulfide isomerase/thioredoxin